MILYLDTSALVKLCVEETGTEAVRDLVDAASVVSTSVVAYPEARSAFARQHREGELGERQLRRVTLALDQHWPRLLAVEATDDLCRRANRRVSDTAGSWQLAQLGGSRPWPSLCP